MTPNKRAADPNTGALCSNKAPTREPNSLTKVAEIQKGGGIRGQEAEKIDISGQIPLVFMFIIFLFLVTISFILVSFFLLFDLSKQLKLYLIGH